MTAAGRLDPRVARTRDAVLDATFDLLAEGGYGAVTVDGVSKLSGVARTTIYRHWPSVPQMVTEAMDCLRPTGQLHPTGDPRRDLRNVLLGIGHPDDARWRRVLPSIVEGAARDPVLSALRREFISHRRAITQELIAQVRTEGDTRDLGLLNDLLVGPIFYRLLMSGDRVDEAFVDALLAQVLGAG